MTHSQKLLYNLRIDNSGAEYWERLYKCDYRHCDKLLSCTRVLVRVGATGATDGCNTTHWIWAADACTSQFSGLLLLSQYFVYFFPLMSKSYTGQLKYLTRKNISHKRSTENQRGPFILAFSFIRLWLIV